MIIQKISRTRQHLKTNMSFVLGVLLSVSMASCEKSEIEPTQETQETAIVASSELSDNIAGDSLNSNNTFALQTIQTTAATSSALDLRVDFGTTVVPANYNNGSQAVSAAVALKDFNTGALTTVKLATVAAFQGNYTNSQVYPTTLGIPQTAAEDAFHGHGTTSVLTLSNLNPSLSYTLSFFASRTGKSSTASLETQYKVIGASSQTVLLEAANNTSKIVKTQAIKPDATGKIRIEIAKGPKNNVDGYYFLNSMSVVQTGDVTTTPTPTPTPTPSYNYLVKTVAELKDALTKATSGQVVYIDDNAKINMTGQGILKLKGGVTLKSGRGSIIGSTTSLGGMLYTTDRKHIMIDITGEKARITGVRLSGPDITTRMEETKAALAAGTFQSLPFSYGVRSNYSGLQIDNSELMGWTKAAISISSSTAHIHHNYIHHNQHYSLGYGVVVNGSANALIEYNSFHLNRHSVAGSGSSGQTYEARFNTFYKNSYTSLPHLDMHSPGGKLINIHDNTFYHKGALAIYLLGTPTERAYIVKNKFASTSQNYTIKTSSNSTISENTYSVVEQSVDNNVTLKTF